MTENELSQLDQVRADLLAVENRIAEIAARREQIPAELAEESKKLGLVIIGKLASGSIHGRMDKLEREQRELAAELQALEPIRAEAAARLDLAEAEAARERFAVLSAEAVEYPVKIYGQLEQLHRDFCKYNDLQKEIFDLREKAGKLAPITDQAEPAIFIPAGVDRMTEAAFYQIQQVNVEALTAAGYKVE